MTVTRCPDPAVTYSQDFMFSSVFREKGGRSADVNLSVGYTFHYDVGRGVIILGGYVGERTYLTCVANLALSGELEGKPIIAMTLHPSS